MSKLGEALSGRAAKAFQHLDAKARGMLDGLVNSGVMKAEDVVRGLDALAAAAEKRHTMESAPGGNASFTGAGQGEKDALSAMSSLDEAFRKGQVSQEEYGRKLRENTKALDAARQAQDVGDSASGISDPVLAGINDRLQQFAKERLKAQSAMAPEDRAALDKLSQFGFDSSVYKDAFARYAAGAEQPVGDSAAAPSAQAPASPAPATEAPVAAKASAGPAIASPAIASQADPSNSQAAISMLQSALNAGSKEAPNVLDAGTAENDTALDVLAQALKSGKGGGNYDKVV